MLLRSQTDGQRVRYAHGTPVLDTWLPLSRCLEQADSLFSRTELQVAVDTDIGQASVALYHKGYFYRTVDAVVDRGLRIAVVASDPLAESVQASRWLGCHFHRFENLVDVARRFRYLCVDLTFAHRHVNTDSGVGIPGNGLGTGVGQFQLFYRRRLFVTNFLCRHDNHFRHPHLVYPWRRWLYRRWGKWLLFIYWRRLEQFDFRFNNPLHDDLFLGNAQPPGYGRCR